MPPEFLWGASASAYQVDGGDGTQWHQWELANAKRLAQESPKKLAWIPHAERRSGQWDKPENYICGEGVAHARMYETDFAIMKQLHMNAFRFGIEWAKLEPTEGEWDEAAIEHYRRYIAALKAKGIEPILTLWHWTMPTWFTDKGGFGKRANVQYFDRYAEKVIQEFGHDVHYILTLNEPNVYTSFGYGSGEWHPNKKQPWLIPKVYRNLAEAHRRTYRMIKRFDDSLQVGIPMNLSDIRPANPRNPLNRLTARLLTWFWNNWFLDLIRDQQDFIGINYYFTEYRTWRGAVRNPAGPVNDLGWRMDPRGIAAVVDATWQRYTLPLLITENGLADGDDTQRQWWIEQTLQAMQASQQKGVPLLGYLHWSLLDNFEWSYGWWPRFGLVAVDREHDMQRTIRPSAYWYGEQIKNYRTSG